MLPDLDVARIAKWIDARNNSLPERAQGQIRYELDVANTTITIVECRPPWRPDLGPEWTRSPIARLRYTKTRKEWSLYWRDRNLKFHNYERVPARLHVEELLAEVDRDPTHIFWG